MFVRHFAMVGVAHRYISTPSVLGLLVAGASLPRPISARLMNHTLSLSVQPHLIQLFCLYFRTPRKRTHLGKQVRHNPERLGNNVILDRISHATVISSLQHQQGASYHSSLARVVNLLYSSISRHGYDRDTPHELAFLLQLSDRSRARQPIHD